MKRPKNRGSVFAVIRTSQYGEFYLDPHLLGVFLTLDRAEEVRDSYIQDFLDRHIEGFKFEVQISNYYDE